MKIYGREVCKKKMGDVEVDDPKKEVEKNFGHFRGVYYHVSQNLRGHAK